jgi:hypothetical protein
MGNNAIGLPSDARGIASQSRRRRLWGSRVALRRCRRCGGRSGSAVVSGVVGAGAAAGVGGDGFVDQDV